MKPEFCILNSANISNQVSNEFVHLKNETCSFLIGILIRTQIDPAISLGYTNKNINSKSSEANETN